MKEGLREGGGKRWEEEKRNKKKARGSKNKLMNEMKQEMRETKLHREWKSLALGSNKTTFVLGKMGFSKCKTVHLNVFLHIYDETLKW